VPKFTDLPNAAHPSGLVELVERLEHGMIDPADLSAACAATTDRYGILSKLKGWLARILAKLRILLAKLED
jgi:hypothetical protein